MHKIILIPGDGIGPEVTEAAQSIIEASGADIDWEVQHAGEGTIKSAGTPLPEVVVESIREHKVALKGPITTPVGSGFQSVNVALRKNLDLYANIRPCKTYNGIDTPFKNVDLVIVRENTEDLYSGMDRMVNPDRAESIKIITRQGSERILHYAFEYAVENNRKAVTAVHKANIMKCTDGLFLSTAQEVSKGFPGIKFDNKIIDALCADLVMKPDKYDVLVLPNLYGDIVSDLCSGLVGGLGITPGCNIGRDIAVFEPVHGSAPGIAGQNKANPIATILSGVLMLKYIGEEKAARRIEDSVISVLQENTCRTEDLGGSMGTKEFTQIVIKNMDR